MTLLHSIIFGIVEGVTEFLPISSTAHLILTADLLKLPQSKFQVTFEIVIQLGAILAVVVLYWKTLFQNIEALKRVIVAFIPTAIIGFLLHKAVKSFFENEQMILGALFIGGLILIAFEMFHKEKSSATATMESISYPQAVLIGCAQSLAIVPGVSRSAATILGGMSLGISRKTIVDFSFLLAVPTMLAASVLDLLKSGSSFSSSEYGMLAVGFVVSFLVAIVAIKWLLKYIQKHTFIVFGVYRVMVAAVFWMIIG